MSNVDKKLPRYLSWEKEENLYKIVIEYDNGTTIISYKDETDFKLEMFKRKLQDEYNVPFAVLNEFDKLVYEAGSKRIVEDQSDY
jgi:hypothetical protein